MSDAAPSNVQVPPEEWIIEEHQCIQEDNGLLKPWPQKLSSFVKGLIMSLPMQAVGTCNRHSTKLTLIFRRTYNIKLGPGALLFNRLDMFQELCVLPSGYSRCKAYTTQRPDGTKQRTPRY